MDRPQLVDRAMAWLTAGYPDGIPTSDYTPVLALLHRSQLTDSEIARVAAALMSRHPSGTDGYDPADGGEPPTISLDAAAAEISRQQLDAPNEADVQRVAAVLAGRGWLFEDATAEPVHSV